MHSGEHILPRRKERTSRIRVLIIAHDYLVSLVAGVAFVAEKLRYIRHILVTAAEGVFAADIVYAD
jgi:DNA phosphorothioation-dependent restriction protein DptG